MTTTYIEAGIGDQRWRIEMPLDAGRQLALAFYAAHHRNVDADELAGLTQDEVDALVNEWLVRAWGRQLRETATAQLARQAGIEAAAAVENQMQVDYGDDKVVIVGPGAVAPVGIAL